MCALSAVNAVLVLPHEERVGKQENKRAKVHPLAGHLGCRVHGVLFLMKTSSAGRTTMDSACVNGETKKYVIFIHLMSNLEETVLFVCGFFPFILDIKFVERTSRGHTGGRSHRISHPSSFCGACLNFSREKDSAILFPRRP